MVEENQNIGGDFFLFYNFFFTLLFFVVLQFSDVSFPIPNPAYLFICGPGRQNKTLRHRFTVVYIWNCQMLHE